MEGFCTTWVGWLIVLSQFFTARVKVVIIQAVGVPFLLLATVHFSILLGYLAVLSGGFVGAVESRNYVGSSFSLWALSMTRT